VSMLSEPNHAGGKFPRPYLQERLDRILKQLKPDLIFACYGMNDGIYLPFDEQRFQKFKDGIYWLHEEVEKVGASIVHLTPPVFDAKNAYFTSHGEAYSSVLETYSDWLIGCRENEGWDVIDIHGPMQKFLEEKRKVNPDFRFAKDGVHPDESGHWIMGRSILLALGEKKVSIAENVDEAIKLLSIDPELLRLISKRQKILKDAWLTATGHERPGMKEGLTIKEADKKILEIDKQILGLKSMAQEFDKDTFQPIYNDKATRQLQNSGKTLIHERNHLNIEVLKEWEEENVIMQVLRYRIGVFRGEKP
jgi:lysophospholipase L1-like esterase